MAEPKMPALTTISPTILTGTDDYQQKYFDAMQKVSAALENRLKEPSTNMWEVAGAFLAPTRTGSFFENLGMASNVLGQQQRRAEERELPIAQMRAQLAGQEYEMRKKEKGLQLAASALGMTDPREAAAAIQGGNMPTGALLNMNPRTIAALSLEFPEYGKALQAGFDMTMKLRQNAIEEAKLGLQTSELKAKYGPEIVASIPPSVFGQGAGQPSGQPTAGKPSTPETLLPRESVIDSLTKDFKLDSSQLSTTRTREQQQSLYDRWKAGEKGIYKPLNPADYPDRQTFHDTAIDVPTSVPESYMNARGWYRPDPKGDPVHYEPMKKPPAAGQVTASSVQDTEPGVFVTADGLRITRGNMSADSWEKAKIDAQKNAVDRMSAYQTKRKEEMAKSDVQQIEGLRNAASTAENLWQLASNQISIVNANPAAFGYLADPSASSAFFRALKDAQNKGLSFNPDEIARYVKGVTNADDLNALTLFANNAIQLNLEFAKMNFKGQGAVTDAERSMIATLGGIAFDSPEVIRLKADALRKNAERNRAVHEAWLDFEDKNPNASYNQFLRSPELKSIKQEYQNIFEQMRKDTEQILKPKNKSKASSSPATSSGVPDLVGQLNAVTGQ